MKKLLSAFMAFLLIIFLYFLGKSFIEDQIQKPYGKKGEFAIVEIKSGMGIKDSALLLQKKEVIKGRIPFLLGYKIYFKGKTIKAGEYKFDFPISIYQVLEKITSGEIYLHQIVIPEGSSIYEIAKILEEENLVRREDFIKACDNRSLISQINKEALNLEGFLFPDTYLFPKGITSEKAILIMIRRFKERVGEYIRVTEKKGLNFYKVLILASLIEKETGVPEEKPLVSSVFYNRLKRGMLLQCDPTVIYALKKEEIFQYPLKKEDLSFPSPYNTYLHTGLPPGPICNPGIASIEAAINPARTDYLYFVSNGDGTHTFSSDLSSHNRAVRNYIRKIRESKKENSFFYR